MTNESTYHVDPAYVASYNSRLRTRINEWLRRQLDAAGYSELSPSHGAVLSIVYKSGGKAQIKTICEALRKGKPTVTEMVNRLVRLGYLEKCACPEDGRAVYVSATPKAVEFHDEFETISKELRETILAGFSEEEAADLARLLERAADNFG
ncbi:MAG: MarR family winged helix-turn-helix transcriptional regulator [Atopobiaceae bacterium]|jgi:DNA-binding MarR family transcriptional regulator